MTRWDITPLSGACVVLAYGLAPPGVREAMIIVGFLLAFCGIGALWLWAEAQDDAVRRRATAAQKARDAQLLADEELRRELMRAQLARLRNEPVRHDPPDPAKMRS